MASLFACLMAQLSILNCHRLFNSSLEVESHYDYCKIASLSSITLEMPIGVASVSLASAAVKTCLPLHRGDTGEFECSTSISKLSSVC